MPIDSNLLSMALRGQGYDPRLGFMDAFNNPNVDTTMTVKSPQGTTAMQGAASAPQAQPQASGQQLSPNMLGAIALMGDLGSAFYGDSPRNKVGATAANFAKNALFNQFLQMMQGGGGQQTAPFNQAL